MKGAGLGSEKPSKNETCAIEVPRSASRRCRVRRVLVGDAGGGAA